MTTLDYQVNIFEDEANWLKQFLDCGFTLPNDYMTVDLETTGFILSNLIVQFGHLFTKDNQPEEAKSYSLNWADHPDVPQGWLRQRLIELEEVRKDQGVPYQLTYDYLIKCGKDPIKVLEIYYMLIKAWQDCDGYFVMHNGAAFDCPMLVNHFKKYLNKTFEFNHERLIDTGMLEKAIQLRLLPGNTLTSFYKSVSKMNASVKWSLSKHCVHKYNLVNKHDLNIDLAHLADFDCHTTHLLLQEYKRLADNGKE